MKEKGLITLLVIFILATIGLAGYICYDKYNSNTKSSATNTTKDTNNSNSTTTDDESNSITSIDVSNTIFKEITKDNFIAMRVHKEEQNSVGTPGNNHNTANYNDFLNLAKIILSQKLETFNTVTEISSIYSIEVYYEYQGEVKVLYIAADSNIVCFKNDYTDASKSMRVTYVFADNKTTVLQDYVTNLYNSLD